MSVRSRWKWCETCGYKHRAFGDCEICKKDREKGFHQTSTGKICFRCRSKMMIRRNCFYWMNKYFTGLYCEKCNSVWDNPNDSFFEYVQSTKDNK